MNKVNKETCMEIFGGHYCTAWPHTVPEAAQTGVAGWEQPCPNAGHTLVHIFNRTAYYYRWGTGREYACPRSWCNQ